MESLLNTESCRCNDCFCNVLRLILEVTVFSLTEAISSNVQHIIYNYIEILKENKLIKFVCAVYLLLGGKIVSSKPFAPLNFRINSRNLSGKYNI